MKYNPNIVLAYFEACGLPEAVTEHHFAKHIDRNWRFDFAFLSERVAVEVEGGLWIGGGHSRPSGVKKDMEKYNAAAVLGWRLLRFEPRHLCILETVNTIKECIANGN